MRKPRIDRWAKPSSNALGFTAAGAFAASLVAIEGIGRSPEGAIGFFRTIKLFAEFAAYSFFLFFGGALTLVVPYIAARALREMVMERMDENGEDLKFWLCAALAVISPVIFAFLIWLAYF